jgi:pSer/pThr/pTyr-binding forkhead associated (FHA) protein
MPLFLQPLSGNSTAGGKSFPIPTGPGSFTVGRSGTNDLCVDDISVSSLHARLESSGVNGVDLVDCDSSNGTFVNGRKIKRKELSANDLVRFASSEFRVVEAEEVPDKVQDLDGRTGRIPLGERESIEEADTAWQSKIDAITEERDRARIELEQLREQLEEKSEEVDSVSRDLEMRSRDVADAGARIEKISRELSKEREGNLEREGQIASLQFELTRRDGVISTTEAQRSQFASERDEWQLAHGQVQEMLATRDAELAASKQETAALLEGLNSLLGKVQDVSAALLSDWKDWIDPESLETVVSAGDDSDLARIEIARLRIRGELDKIEPIWRQFGDGVQEELKRRCNQLKEEQRDLVEENRIRKGELEKTMADLAEVRKEVDEAVRRAQGLSRRGTEVAIPERFESMVIARDREQEIYSELIAELEFYDQLLTGYRRNRKMKEALPELENFRKKLVRILSDQGVHEYEVPVGTMLTLKQRREVQILGKKGWGTREYIEQPYQPGEVTRIVRSGYRVGDDDHGVILRKVEVLIREAAE